MTQFDSLVRTQKTGRVPEKDRLSLAIAAPEFSFLEDGTVLSEFATNMAKMFHRRGHDVSVITPWYPDSSATGLPVRPHAQKLSVPRQGKVQNQVEATVKEIRWNKINVYAIEQEAFFGAIEPGKPESQIAAFSFYSRALVEFARQFSLPFDVLQCLGWQSALAPVYRSHYYGDELDSLSIQMLIHEDLEVGSFGQDLFAKTGLPQHFNKDSELRLGDTISFLNGGILYADRVAAVSARYRDDLASEAISSLGEALREREDALEVLYAGVDPKTWSPARDRQIEYNYDYRNPTLKKLNKPVVQRAVDLPVFPDIPLVSIVERTSPSGELEAIFAAITTILEQAEGDIQIIWRRDEHTLEDEAVEELARNHPDSFAVVDGEDSLGFRKLVAGSDVFVPLSRTEPSAISALIAMRYGAVPLAYRFGAISDLAINLESPEWVTDEPRVPGSERTKLGKAFMFDTPTGESVRDAFRRVLTFYDNYRNWVPIVEKLLEADFSWSRRTADYEAFCQSKDSTESNE